MIRKAIDQTGRKIVFSTSPGETPIANGEHVKNHANQWRIIGDFWDNWKQLSEEFEVCNRWSPFIGVGHFPDADMLPLGHIGIRAERGNDRMCGLTKDEQITMMSLFAIFRSPLMFGGNLPDNDEFTQSLITNKAVLKVNQHSSFNRQLFNRDNLIAWIADVPNSNDKYLAVFNTSDKELNEQTIPVSLEQLGFKGTCTVTDLWTNKTVGKFTGEFAPAIRKHASGLYRVKGKGN